MSVLRDQDNNSNNFYVQNKLGLLPTPRTIQSQNVRKIFQKKKKKKKLRD